MRLSIINTPLIPYIVALAAPFVRKFSFKKMASEREKTNLMSLEFDVLLSEIHEGKSVILTASAVKFKDLLKQRNGKDKCC